MSVLNGYGIIHMKIISKEKRKRIALNYKTLWIQLAKKGLKKTEVIVIAQITTNVMAQMGKNKPITFKNLAKYVMHWNVLQMMYLVLRRVEMND